MIGPQAQLTYEVICGAFAAHGLQIIPAASYKSDLIQAIPLVPQAVDILNWVLTHHPRSNGPYIFSGTDGEKPASGWTKAQKRMRDAIYANTGEFPKPWTPHAIRRAVATDVAEATGESGDKLVEKVLGHADRGATEIYNRYRGAGFSWAGRCPLVPTWSGTAARAAVVPANIILDGGIG
jgi:integrase